MPVDTNFVPTWEQPVPHVPGEGDLLNGEKANSTPTVAPQNAAAEEFMQIARQVLAAAKMIALLRITVSSSATVLSFASVRRDTTLTALTVNHHATGDVEITWPANTFPAPSGAPQATLNAGVLQNASIDAVNTSNGVRVRTSVAGAATDLAFTVDVR